MPTTLRTLTSTEIAMRLYQLKTIPMFYYIRVEGFQSSSNNSDLIFSPPLLQTSLKDAIKALQPKQRLVIEERNDEKKSMVIIYIITKISHDRYFVKIYQYQNCKLIFQKKIVFLIFANLLIGLLNWKIGLFSNLAFGFMLIFQRYKMKIDDLLLSKTLLDVIDFNHDFLF